MKTEIFFKVGRNLNANKKNAPLLRATKSGRVKKRGAWKIPDIRFFVYVCVRGVLGGGVQVGGVRMYSLSEFQTMKEREKKLRSIVVTSYPLSGVWMRDRDAIWLYTLSYFNNWKKNLRQTSGSSINEVTVSKGGPGGGGQVFCDDKALSNKKLGYGGMGVKVSRFAWRHLWTTPLGTIVYKFENYFVSIARFFNKFVKLFDSFYM